MLDCGIINLDPTLCNTGLSIFTNIVTGLFGIALFGAMLVLAVVHGRRRSWAATGFALATATYSLGLAVRVLPWGIGMWFATDGDRYHPLLIDNRHWTYGPSLPLIVLGIWGSIHIIFTEKCARRVFFWISIAVVVVGLAASVSFLAAENDIWPGRLAIVEKVEQFIGYERAP